MISRKIQEQKEYNLINGWVNYSNSCGNHFILEECPIQSIKQSQLGKNQSIPDAIVNDCKNKKSFFVEVTHFSAGPFLATLMDILGVLIYCYVVKLILF